MITGTSQADAAVLVVAADDGIKAQTKEHLWLAKVMGVEQPLDSFGIERCITIGSLRFACTSPQARDLYFVRADSRLVSRTGVWVYSSASTSANFWIEKPL